MASGGGESHLTDRWRSISAAPETGVVVKAREGVGDGGKTGGDQGL